MTYKYFEISDNGKNLSCYIRFHLRWDDLTKNSF